MEISVKVIRHMDRVFPVENRRDAPADENSPAFQRQVGDWKLGSVPEARLNRESDRVSAVPPVRGGSATGVSRQ